MMQALLPSTRRAIVFFLSFLIPRIGHNKSVHLLLMAYVSEKVLAHFLRIGIGLFGRRTDEIGRG
jgi:hypothetical protein